MDGSFGSFGTAGHVERVAWPLVLVGGASWDRKSGDGGWSWGWGLGAVGWGLLVCVAKLQDT